MGCDHPPMVKYVLMVQLHNILILLIIIKKEKCIRTFEGGKVVYSIEDDNGSLIVEATPDFSRSDIHPSVLLFTLL